MMAEIPQTRASLLLRLRDSEDQAAWEEFVRLYMPFVYGYCRKQGLQDADAADLSQDVLQALTGGVGRLSYDPERGAFRNWLFTIVRRKLLNWRAARARSVRNDLEIEDCPATPEEEEAWDEEWERQVFAWACDQVRRDVTDQTWQAFWRTAFEGRRGKVVAAELGLTVTAVYNARSRVQTRLKELIQAARERDM